MNTTPRAARSTDRDGRPNLTLVTDDNRDSFAPEDPQRGRHAAPARSLQIAGSATMRAIMALGALVSAVTLSIGKAEAALSHGGHPIEEAEPSLLPIPETPTSAGTGPKATAPTVHPTKAPTTHLAATHTSTAASHVAADGSKPKATVKTAGEWAPTVKSGNSVWFKVSSGQGTGRHRLPLTTMDEQQRVQFKPTGRHRRPVTTRPTSGPTSTSPTSTRTRMTILAGAQ